MEGDEFQDGHSSSTNVLSALEKKIQRRPQADELMSQGILKDAATAEVEEEEEQRLISALEKKLRLRPTTQDLHNVNILKGGYRSQAWRELGRPADGPVAGRQTNSWIDNAEGVPPYPGYGVPVQCDTQMRTSST
jgi:hypothetical protein